MLKTNRILRKFIIVAIVISVCFAMSATAFATESNDNVITDNVQPLIPNSDAIGDITLYSSHDRTVTVYIGTSSGTEYNSAKTRKCVWTESHYKVYYENIATRNRRLAYDLYKWSWTGYEKSGSSWVKITSKSGSNRTHVNASSIGDWLTSF